jgi:hypothetical protein
MIKSILARLIGSQSSSPKTISKEEILKMKNLKIQMGCGDDHLDGFVNMDCRATRAADFLGDLNVPDYFSPGSVDLVYSNAFFEHLYRNQKLPHLQTISNVLSANGLCLYIGLPYFPEIARLYLEKGPGIVGESFDLFHVYRYTHGDPEAVDPSGWFEQLHKSLFDGPELAQLLKSSGFGASLVFYYSYPGEEKTPVNCGFLASKSEVTKEKLKEKALELIQEIAGPKVMSNTLQFLM